MKELKWETKKVKVKDLIQLEINPRKITEEKKQKLIESLKKFNLAEIPAVNTDMKIIGGNQRVAALILMGREDEEIDVRVPNRELTDVEMKEYVITSNTHAGEFDFDILDSDFADIDFSDIGFDINGLDIWELKKDAILAGDAGDDGFIVPPGGSDTDIVLGDVFKIGDHKLICGSSLETDTWEKIMKNEMADLVVTDPPYNVDYTGGTKEKLNIKNDSMTAREFYEFLYDFYVSQSIYIKAGGSWYVWHSDSNGGIFRTAMEDSGIPVKQCLIWVKQKFVMGRQDYHWQHEPCLYGWKPGAKHNWYGDRKQSTVLNFDRPDKNTEHPTMKPIPLIAYQIGNSSKKGDLVCDGFGGSGTTMVASHQMKRVCRMVELDPKYCQVIIDRMRALDPEIEILRNGEKYEAKKPKD